MPESFVHRLRFPIWISFIEAITNLTGQSVINAQTNTSLQFRLPCYNASEMTADPFTTFPTVDIAFLDASSAKPTSHFYLKPSEYLAKVADYYCVLATLLPSTNNLISFIGEPGLYNKYLHYDHTNRTVGWINAPKCTPQQMQLVTDPTGYL
ncbi:hypothetical protein CLOM_g6487 [Closterium sp. NIES-68]|nr:hypothetical protein CLOM_g6487 [Closterium sp. NIES-68]